MQIHLRRLHARVPKQLLHLRDACPPASIVVGIASGDELAGFSFKEPLCNSAL